MNTVKDAQEVYREVKARCDTETKTLLFHARFLQKDRDVIEAECLSIFGKDGSLRPKKAILVATQVVEQSLDVDFDYMISAIAPIDLLLQRMGRLHRHSRTRPNGLEQPKFCVFCDKEGSSSSLGGVYDKWVIQQTHQALLVRQTIQLPSDIRTLIEEVYRASDATDCHFSLWLEKMAEEQVLIGRAKGVVFPRPSGRFFPLETGTGEFFEDTSSELVKANATTRVGGNTVKLAILPKHLWQLKKLADPALNLAREVLQHSVSIRLPTGCFGLDPAQVQECGGYLRGCYALEYRDNITLRFLSTSKNITKEYTVDNEYGLKEE